MLNKEAKKVSKKVKVHVEVDTGMGRCGLLENQVLPFFEQMQAFSQIEIEGIYTHFSSADDEDRSYTEKQIALFEKEVKQLQERGFSFRWIHAQASGGIMGYDVSICNLVRPGIILYGYAPAEFLKNGWNLRPATRLISHIVFQKEVPKGTSISYGRTYTTSQTRKIATIPLGYADGIRRILSNRGTVKIKGKEVPMIGNICMDNFMVDVSEIDDVKVGEEVILWEGNEIETIAEKCQTIPYEILCGISKRVERKYLD